MTELPSDTQAHLESVLDGLEHGAQELFSKLIERLDANPRRVLLLMTSGLVSKKELAGTLDCAPTSIIRYKQAIRRKLTQIVREQTC